MKLTRHPYLMAKLRKMELNFHFLIHLHAMIHIMKELEFLNKVTHIQVPYSLGFLAELHNYQLLKEDSATLHYLFSARVVFH